MRLLEPMSEVHPLPRVARLQLVTIDRGLGTVELQYLDADGDAHEVAMNLEEARRLFAALESLAEDVG